MDRMTNSIRILEHTLFWFVYWIFISFSGGLYDFDFTTISLYTLSLLPLTIGTTYLFVYKILPIYFKRKVFYFILYSILLLFIAIVSKRLSIQYIQFPLFYANQDFTFDFFNWYRIVQHLLQICATIGIVSAIKLYRNWRKVNSKMEVLQIEKRNAELNFLRAQVHPHFLHNTLNSIYYEAIKKTDKTADLIIQLSDLLRFTLQECNKNSILLTKEIELIDNYIALEKSRYGSRVSVIFKVDGDTKKEIPPLICFSLIENAFKHGVAEQTENCVIEILLNIKKDQLILKVTNPLNQTTGSKDFFGASKGIGLDNVTKQLNLIFNKSYTLKNEIKENTFTSYLQIPV